MVHDAQGFLKHDRTDTPKRPVAERIHDWAPIYLSPSAESVGIQASRCMDCGVAFCHAGCPLGNLIPDWNELVASGEWSEASDRLHATNNFPEFTGWICPAPCESACVLAINAPAVTIKQVELSIVDNAFDAGGIGPAIPAQRTGRRVAVIGSGPAGLAAAQQLSRAGHEVTVFERDDRPGGLLRYGIPDFKLPKDIIDRRLEQMRAEGTRFVLGATIGPQDASMLRERFDATILAIGALKGRRITAEGAGLGGIHQAMAYLPGGNRVQAGDLVEPPIDAHGKHVVIIGGGDTAADCLGAANRQGALSVTVLDHNPRPEHFDAHHANPIWPIAPITRGASPAHDEGVHEAWSREAVEFLADAEGAVRAVIVETVEVTTHEGRRAFRPVQGSREELPAELVLVAAGFVGTDSPDLVTALGGAIDPARGTPVVDADWRVAPGVYACGDASRGASLVVWAIAEGRAAAASVHADLGGTIPLPSPVVPHARSL